MATTFTDEMGALTRSPDNASSRPSLLSRFVSAITESRRRTAEREIERYIMLNGGVLTDRVERDLSRNFGKLAG
jgi:hypothetical protein